MKVDLKKAANTCDYLHVSLPVLCPRQSEHMKLIRSVSRIGGIQIVSSSRNKKLIKVVY